MSLRTLIVDDEPLARERLRSLLGAEPDVEVVGEAGDGVEAVRALASGSIDLVFLDVQMPEMDGFEVLEALGKLREGDGPTPLPAVVFVTAYDRYALRAFDVHALDYLLKPFDTERFARTLRRVRSRLERERGRETKDRLQALLSETEARRDYLERFMVRSRGRVLFLRADEVDWVEAAGNYVSLHVGSKDHLLRETMTWLESRLDPDSFLRIHRSIIVRIDRIREIRPAEHGDYEVVLAAGTRLPLSRTYYRRARERLNVGS